MTLRTLRVAARGADSRAWRAPRSSNSVGESCAKRMAKRADAMRHAARVRLASLIATLRAPQAAPLELPSGRGALRQQAAAMAVRSLQGTCCATMMAPTRATAQAQAPLLDAGAVCACAQAAPTPSGVRISGKGAAWGAPAARGVASNVRISGKGEQPA